ncbi:mammalian uncoordinated homology 13 protein [Tanacetum coccineum]
MTSHCCLRGSGEPQDASTDSSELHISIKARDLLHIAVEDSVDSDDGGKAIIREMPPFEAEVAIANLVKGWTKLRLDRLKE